MMAPVMNPNERQVGGAHYGGTSFQHWDWAEWNGLGYMESAITKYVLRWRGKDGVEALHKAIHYTEKLMEQFCKIERRNRATPRLNARTEELFQNMKTQPREREICQCILTWKTYDHLKSIKYKIEALLRLEGMEGESTS